MFFSVIATMTIAKSKNILFYLRIHFSCAFLSKYARWNCISHHIALHKSCIWRDLADRGSSCARRALRHHRMWRHNNYTWVLMTLSFGVTTVFGWLMTSCLMRNYLCHKLASLSLAVSWYNMVMVNSVVEY